MAHSRDAIFDHLERLSQKPEVKTCLAASLILTLYYSIFKFRKSRTSLDDAQSSNAGFRVPLVPYWIPFLGHAFRLAFQPDILLRGTRDASPNGIFAIVLGGSTHNMVFAPSLAQSIFSQRPNVVDFEEIVWWILQHVGGIGSKWKPNFDNGIEGLNMAVKNNLTREPELGRIIRVTVQNIEHNAARFITFSRSPIDYEPWEKSSQILLHEDSKSQYIEADLLPLILDFIGYQALPSLFGSDFTRNNPHVLKDLWEFNAGFLYLAAGLPWWVPIPKLSRAYLARRRLVKSITTLQEELDSLVEGRDCGEDWMNLDDVSPLIKQRHQIYRENGIPPSIRAPGDLAILWAQNANSNFAIFWLLLRIFSEPGLVDELRTEVEPYVQRVSIQERLSQRDSLSDLKIDDKALTSMCPLLKACFIESLRLDSAPWSVRSALKDFFITEDKNDVVKGHTPKTFKVEKGSYVNVPFDLHFTDPKYFPDPEKFQPGRHIRLFEKRDTLKPDLGNVAEAKTAEWNTVRPFGGGKTVCKALLICWDFEPVEGSKGWRIPKHGKATGVNMPLENIRVKIKKRL